MITIRKLEKDDYLEYKLIRLEMLQNHPTAFGSDYESESLFSDETWIKRLSKSSVDTYAAFKATEIIGICVVVTNPRLKMKHISTLHSMYIKPEFRGKDYSKVMIRGVIKELKKRKTLRLNLSVATVNVPAISLYKSIGFVEYGVEPQAIKHQNRYYDLVYMSLLLKK